MWKVIFLIPLVEHLTERSKLTVARFFAKKGYSVYLSHHLAPFYSFLIAGLLCFLFGQLGFLSDLNETIWSMVIISGGSSIWYEISSLWRKKKREAVPLITDSLEDEIDKVN